MKIEVYKYVLPCNREDEVTVIGPNDLIHAFENNGIMYISKELQDLVEGSMELRPITNTELKKALKGD